MTERENFCRNIAAVSYGRYNGRKGDRKACGRTLSGTASASRCGGFVSYPERHVMAMSNFV